MRHPHRLARAARLKPALLTLLLAGAGPYGCVIAPEDAASPAAPDAGTRVDIDGRDNAHDTDETAGPDGNEDGELAEPEPTEPEPTEEEPEISVPEIGWWPGPPQCIAACDRRRENIGMDGLCMESGYACLDACNATLWWMSPFAESALSCLAEDFLCYELLAGCAMRRSEVPGINLQVTLTGIDLGEWEGLTVTAAQNWDEIDHARSFAGGMVTAEVRDGAFSLVIPTWLGAYGGQLNVWIDQNGDGECNVGDLATQVWMNMYEPPLSQPEIHPLANGELAVVLNPDQVRARLLRRERDASARCPQDR